MGPQIHSAVAAPPHRILRTLRGFGESLQEQRFQLCEQRHKALASTFVMFGLATSDEHRSRLEVDVLPLERKHFTWTSKPAVAAQREDQLPFGRGASVQDLDECGAVDERLAVPVGFNAGLELSEGVCREHPLVDGDAKELLGPSADAPGRVRPKAMAQEESPELSRIGNRDGIQRLILSEKRQQVFAGRFQIDDRARLGITSVGNVAVDERAKCYGPRFPAWLNQACRGDPAVHQIVARGHPPGRFIVWRITKNARGFQLLNPQLKGLGLILRHLAEPDPLARPDRPKLDPLPPIWFVTHTCHLPPILLIVFALFAM